MFAKNHQISGRQAMRLLTFDLLGYSALMIPAALAKEAGRDGIWGIVLGTAAGFLYLRLLKAAGSVTGRRLKIAYALYFLLLAGKVASVFAELVVTELLEKQFRLILTVILLLTWYGTAGGIEGRARVYEILFWILLLPLFVLLAGAVPTVDTDYFMPVFTAEPLAVLTGAYRVFLCFSVLSLLPFLSEFVRDKEQLYKSGRNALAVTGFILFVLYLILLGMFGDKALATIEYPAVTMMSRVQMTGGFLKRTDAIMFGIWFFTLFALLNSLVFFSSRLLAELPESILRNHAEKFSKKNGMRYTLIFEMAAVWLLADRFYLHEEFARFCDLIFCYIGTPFAVLVPTVLVCLKKGRRRMQ